MLFFFYLISRKMQKSNVTSFLRVALKKLARKKVKKFAFDHCKTGSERFVIWRDNFSFIIQRKEDKEMSENWMTKQELVWLRNADRDLERWTLSTWKPLRLRKQMRKDLIAIIALRIIRLMKTLSKRPLIMNHWK